MLKALSTKNSEILHLRYFADLSLAEIARSLDLTLSATKMRLYRAKALTKAFWMRKPGKGLIFHSDRGSQYTSKQQRKLLKRYRMRASMGDVAACWDPAVVERSFGSLKHDWIFKQHQPTREHMEKDVAAFMKYYNLERLHTANNDMSPINHENSLK